MSNKQESIITGIDVSECFYYSKDNEPYCCEIWGNECEVQNCYFKQLKRLQEENEELKKKNKELLNLSNKGGALLVAESTKNKKYKQALEEIREKCLKMCNICDNINGETYLDDCNSICEYCKIIKLIDEVLNGRD